MPAMIFMHHTPRGCALVLGTSIKGKSYTRMQTSDARYPETAKMQSQLANYMRMHIAQKNTRPTLKDLWDLHEKYTPESEWKYLASTPTTVARILLKGSL